MPRGATGSAGPWRSTGTPLIGAYHDAEQVGSVYVFRTSDGGASYDQVGPRTASTPGSCDRFGVSVAIDGATVVVGASTTTAPAEQSYVFSTTDGGATYHAGGQAGRPSDGTQLPPLLASPWPSTATPS